MNDDLISRSWLLEQLEDLGDTRLIKRNFVALVTNAPTVDVVPVVRCRGCKLWCEYHAKSLDGPGLGDGDCVESLNWKDHMRADDFCSRGERMNGNGQTYR